MFLFLLSAKLECLSHAHMKVLVVRFSNLGDIVLATPVIRVLKSQLQHSVHFATMETYEQVLIANPYIDQIHLLKKSLIKLIKELKSEQFDVMIDLQPSYKTRAIKVALGCPSLTLTKLTLRKWMLVNTRLNFMPSNHMVDRFIKVLEPIGGKMDSLGVDYFIPDKDEVESNWLPETHQNGFAVLALSVDYRTRQLPVKRLIELCDRINKPIVLIGDEKDQAIAGEIETFFAPGSEQKELEIEPLNKKTIIFNGCGKFSINQSASIISKANWVFTHDSGMMHVAAAFKKPIFSIWGNTVPEFGAYPYRTQFTIFENKQLKCRPCTKTGHEKCPKGHFKCMNELTFDFYLPD